MSRTLSRADLKILFFIIYVTYGYYFFFTSLYLNHAKDSLLMNRPSILQNIALIKLKLHMLLYLGQHLLLE